MSTPALEVSELVGELVGLLPRLERALTFPDLELSEAGAVSGGTPSYELISLGIEALLADIGRETSECLDELPRDIAWPYVRPPALTAALWRLVAVYEAARAQCGLSEGVERCRREVASWHRRARVLLGLAWAPYRLTGPDGYAVLCPVVEWRADLEGAERCRGLLFVHRDDGTGALAGITCEHTKRHTWDMGPGWLRLGALLA